MFRLTSSVFRLTPLLAAYPIISSNEEQKKVILSLDGGGIRGIIEAHILAEIERKTGKPCHELFDMVVGTSTGGLIACGLTTKRVGYDRPFRAEELVEFFRNRSSEIFPTVSYVNFAYHVLYGPKYTETVTKNGIERLLRENFGEAKLSQALKPLVITAVDIGASEIFLFKSHRVGQKKYHDFYIRDICRATSAAPTYFPPALITSTDKPDFLTEPPRFALVDGGLAANNPVAVAYEEARKLFGQEVDIKMVSIGTGRAGEEPLKIYSKDHQVMAEQVKKANQRADAVFNKAKDRGLVAWIVPMFTLLFDGQSTKDDYMVRKLENLGPTKADYTRLQIYFGDEDIEMDKTSDIPKLESLVKEYMAREGNDRVDQLIAICG